MQVEEKRDAEGVAEIEEKKRGGVEVYGKKEGMQGSMQEEEERR